MIRSFGPDDLFFLLEATNWTIVLSLVAFTGGSIGGVPIALCRVSSFRILRWTAIVFIRLIQGTPLLMQLFLLFFGIAVLGYNINPWLAAAVGLSINASAFLGEIWRGCIEAVPREQWEAGTMLGLGYGDRMRFIILPQAIRIACAPTIGFAVQLVKSTSLTAIIGFTELTRAGQIVNNVTFRPFLVFGIVAVLYFILCWPLSLLSRRIERRTVARIYDPTMEKRGKGDWNT